MEKMKWLFLPALLFLLAATAIPCCLPTRAGDDLAPFAVAVAMGAALCFLGTLALIGWQEWLDFQHRKNMQEHLGLLQEETLAKYELQIADLKHKLQKAENKLDKLKPTARPDEERLLSFAEKLRTKTTLQTERNKPTVHTTDEVPAEVRDFIIKNFPEK